MNSIDMQVNITPEYAAELVIAQVENGSISAELLDRYHAIGSEGQAVTMLVFEKYFMRTSSRASLTVLFESLDMVTKVHAVGSGGGQSAMFKFDWGAGSNFIEEVRKALQEYRI